MDALSQLATALGNGEVRVVDLTHTLDPDFPVIVPRAIFLLLAPRQIGGSGLGDGTTHCGLVSDKLEIHAIVVRFIILAQA